MGQAEQEHAVMRRNKIQPRECYYQEEFFLQNHSATTAVDAKEALN